MPQKLLVLAEAPRVGADGGLDRERVAAQRLALRVARERLPGPISGYLHRSERARVHRWPKQPSRTRLPKHSSSRADAASRAACGRPETRTRRCRCSHACVLAQEEVRLENVPRIRDVETMMALLNDIGGEAEWTGPNEVRDQRRARPTATSSRRACAAACALRSCSPARCSRASAARSCPRPAATRSDAAASTCTCTRWPSSAPTSATRSRSSSAPTGSPASASTWTSRASPGRRTRSWPRSRPRARPSSSTPRRSRTSRISATSSRRIGARIEGIGSNTLRIEGVRELGGGTWRICPDHVEVGSFIGCAAVTGRRRHHRRVPAGRSRLDPARVRAAGHPRRGRRARAFASRPGRSW